MRKSEPMVKIAEAGRFEFLFDPSGVPWTQVYYRENGGRLMLSRWSEVAQFTGRSVKELQAATAAKMARG